MNTKNSIEERILESFRNLSENQKEKFLSLIENLKADALQSGKTKDFAMAPEDMEFFKILENRHLKVSADLNIDDLMKDINNGLS